MPDSQKPIGTRLRELRKDAGLTQERLGEVLDRSREWVSAVENNDPDTIKSLPHAIIKQWTLKCRRIIAANGKLSVAEERVNSVLSWLTSGFR